MSKSLLISFKKSNISDSIVIKANHLNKGAIGFKKIRNFGMFLTVFHWFSIFLCPRANHSFRSSLSWATVSNWLSSLFTKKRPWANRSCCSLKRTTVSDLLRLLMTKEQRSYLLFFTRELLFHSFAHKKRAIHTKNGWANSRPWVGDVSSGSNFFSI